MRHLEISLLQNFSVCTKCSRLGQLYHKLQHHKHKMFQMATEVVEERRRSSANPDTTKILNELLANEVWLEQVCRFESTLFPLWSINFDLTKTGGAS